MYRVTYTMYLDVEAEDEEEAITKAAKVDLDEFYISDVTTEEI